MRRAAALAIGVILAAVSSAACRGESDGVRRAAPRPNILLVTIDTLRADRMDAGVAPRLDELAASGLRFTAARSAVPLTLPSHATILTGLLPPAHGVRENGLDTLDARHPTIATLLKDAGYRTAAVVGAFVLDRRFGLARGFDVYDDRIPRDPNAAERLEAERRASAVVDRALAILDEHLAPGTEHPTPGTAHPAPGKEHPAPSPQHPAPFLLWLHLYDPHAPYETHTETESSERRTKNSDTERYDGEVAYVDAQLARLFARLGERGLRERTLIVVAGDHGEGLGEHGESTHGMLLYDSTLRVPLVVAGPGVAAAVRNDPVSLADVAPTILRAAGLAPAAAMRGRDLLAGKGGTGGSGNAGGTDGAGDVYAETQYPRVAGWSPLQALTDGRWKAIRAGAATALYDLASDPREEHDVASSQATTAAALTARMAAIGAGSGSAARTISPDAQQRLRALGYVAGGASPAAPTGAPNPAAFAGAWSAFEAALSALNAGRPDAAARLARLAADHPDAPVFQTTYARALKDGGKLTDALDVYRRAAKRWPTDPTLLHDLAVAARDLAARAHGAAADALREEAANADHAALTVDPDSAVAHNGLGLLAADQARPADAAREFARAAALDPNNAAYWTNLGNATRGAGDARAAEQAYRRALDVDANAADAANGLGVLLVEAQKPAEAATWFERALAAAPDLVEARLNLGIARQQSGDARRAAEAYRAVLAARGDHPREKQAATKLLATLRAAP